MSLMKQRFGRGWTSGGKETPCGSGSTMASTARLRKWLPQIFDTFNVQTINDAGCGDLHWISALDLGNRDYLGLDVVWRKNDLGLKISTADICTDQLRNVDLTICRDVLIHLPNDLVLQALENFRRSSRYLLATSFEGVDNRHRGLQPGGFAKLNLEGRPFDLGPPTARINERFRCKYLGLWTLNRENA